MAQFFVMCLEGLRDDEEQGQLALEVDCRDRCTAVRLVVEDGRGTDQPVLVALHSGEALEKAVGHDQVEAVAVIEQQHQMPHERHLRPALGGNDEGELVRGCFQVSHGSSIYVD